jgi:hypothetical protein
MSTPSPQQQTRRKKRADAGGQGSAESGGVAGPRSLEPSNAVPIPTILIAKQFKQIIVEERWGAPDGPDLLITMPVKPSGVITVLGKDTWGVNVPTPDLKSAARIVSIWPSGAAEKYRFKITWDDGSTWLVVQQQRRPKLKRKSSR